MAAIADKFGANVVGIRAEHLEIAPGDGTWSGKVIYSENLGSDSYIYVDIGDGRAGDRPPGRQVVLSRRRHGQRLAEARRAAPLRRLGPAPAVGPAAP